MKETYNGYTNYATWNVALWLNGEYDDYKYWSAMAEKHSDKDLAIIMKHDLDGFRIYKKARARDWQAYVGILRHEAPKASQVKNGICTIDEYVRFTLEDTMREHAENFIPSYLGGFYADILTYAIACYHYCSDANRVLDGQDVPPMDYTKLLRDALDSVDWLEVAQSFTED